MLARVLPLAAAGPRLALWGAAAAWGLWVAPRWPSSFLGENRPTADPRLEELKRQLANNNGEPPFAISNETILKAVPKKKPSYRRTRQKLYAPGDKQVKHLDNLVRCPACGHFKRSHFMCMHCFAEIRTFLKARRSAEFPPKQNQYPEIDEIDHKILYPGKRVSEHERELKRKEWIPKREEPLEYQKHTRGRDVL